MIFSNPLSIFSQKSRLCDFLSCLANVWSFKYEIFYRFSAFFVSGWFSRVAMGTLKTCLVTFLNDIPGGLLEDQVIRIFPRTFFEFWALKNATLV